MTVVLLLDGGSATGNCREISRPALTHSLCVSARRVKSGELWISAGEMIRGRQRKTGGANCRRSGSGRQRISSQQYSSRRL
jgi:hypothetical protein